MERFIPVEIFRKKVIPFEVLPFLLYHLFGLLVPGFMSKESEKFTGIFENGTTPCFRCQKKISIPFDGNFSPKFPYKR